MFDLIPTENSTALALATDLDRAQSYAVQDKAASTRRIYKTDWRLFEEFCQSRGVPALPASPAVVCSYLAFEADRGLKPSTLGRRLAGLKYAHELAGYESPTSTRMVKSTLSGIRRAKGVAPVKKTAAVAEITKGMSRAVPETLKGLRDRAIILLGFGMAARRSELVALDVSDLEFTEDGVRVFVRRSKTDQCGEGYVVPVIRGSADTCPVRAIREWLNAAGITEGPVFRPCRKGGRLQPVRLKAATVNDVVKAYAGKLELDPAQFGAHSLRSGFLTSAAERGASIFKMRDVSRHRSMDVLQGYVQSADAFKDHAGAGLL